MSDRTNHIKGYHGAMCYQRFQAIFNELEMLAKNTQEPLQLVVLTPDAMVASVTSAVAQFTRNWEALPLVVTCSEFATHRIHDYAFATALAVIDMKGVVEQWKGFGPLERINTKMQWKSVTQLWDIGDDDVVSSEILYRLNARVEVVSEHFGLLETTPTSFVSDKAPPLRKMTGVEVRLDENDLTLPDPYPSRCRQVSVIDRDKELLLHIRTWANPAEISDLTTPLWLTNRECFKYVHGHGFVKAKLTGDYTFEVSEALDKMFKGISVDYPMAMVPVTIHFETLKR